jgi:hypothetical protein
MRGLLLLLVAALGGAAPAAAQALVVSERPEAVAVTLYRDPARGAGAPAGIADWPGGYALVTETRTIRVPAGRSVIRFVGVAEGLMPETAIVTGLPQGVGEKNRDARLLSPASLIDAYLKRRVTIRRTDPATGRVRTGEAVIQSGPQGGVVLTTAHGVEALGCAGLPEALRYPGVPADLAARPTLSVTGDSPAAATVTVQLSYLAQGFDWSANYVADIAADGRTLDLFAWLTVVNGGAEGFAGARTAAVAGAPNKEAAAPLPRGPAPELRLRCWPMDVTSTHPTRRYVRLPWIDAVTAEDIGGFEDIVVTGSRVAMAAPPPPVMAPVPVMVAEQEALGDLKLYRVPEPVTVAARSRKQVAMIVRPGVRFARVTLGRFDVTAVPGGGAGASRPALVTLRLQNLEGEGLGVPLPAGRVAVFQAAGERPLLLGESDLADRAVGEEVELTLGESSDVRYAVVAHPPAARRQGYTVTVTNALAEPQRFELPIPFRGLTADQPLGERKGVPTWSVTVPANGRATLALVVKLER